MPHRLRRRTRLLPSRRRLADGAAPHAHGVRLVDTDLLIRSASAADEAAITKLYVQLKHHHAQLMPEAERYQVSDERWADIARHALADPDQRFDIALLDDEPVAFVRYYFEEKPWGLSIEVETLVVDEAHRGSGIGERLMSHVEESARAAGARGVRVNVLHVNERGRKFYETRGYGKTAVRYGKPL